MSDAVFYDILRLGLWIATIISVPILAAALFAGVTVGLFQALTSVQEMTLTFVPKIVGIFAVIRPSLGFMTETLSDFFRADLVPLIAGDGR